MRLTILAVLARSGAMLVHSLLRIIYLPCSKQVEFHHETFTSNGCSSSAGGAGALIVRKVWGAAFGWFGSIWGGIVAALFSVGDRLVWWAFRGLMRWCIWRISGADYERYLGVVGPQ